MSFGLEVFDENGNKTLGLTSNTALLNMVFIVAVKGASIRTLDYSAFGSHAEIIRIRNNNAWAEVAIVVTGSSVSIDTSHALADLTVHVGVFL